VQPGEAQWGFEEQYGAAPTTKESTDPESYETRRGKVRGLADYLSQSDVGFCTEVMVRLNSEYSRQETFLRNAISTLLPTRAEIG